MNEKFVNCLYEMKHALIDKLGTLEAKNSITDSEKDQIMIYRAELKRTSDIISAYFRCSKT